MAPSSMITAVMFLKRIHYFNFCVWVCFPKCCNNQRFALQGNISYWYKKGDKLMLKAMLLLDVTATKAMGGNKICLSYLHSLDMRSIIHSNLQMKALGESNPPPSDVWRAWLKESKYHEPIIQKQNTLLYDIVGGRLQFWTKWPISEARVSVGSLSSSQSWTRPTNNWGVCNAWVLHLSF